MGTMDANMGEAERIPVFAEAQIRPRSTANLEELRTSLPARPGALRAPQAGSDMSLTCR